MYVLYTLYSVQYTLSFSHSPIILFSDGFQWMNVLYSRLYEFHFYLSALVAVAAAVELILCVCLCCLFWLMQTV